MTRILQLRLKHVISLIPSLVSDLVPDQHAPAAVGSVAFPTGGALSRLGGDIARWHSRVHPRAIF